MKNRGVPISILYPMMKTMTHKGYELNPYFRYASFDSRLLQDKEARITEQELERLMVAAVNYTQDDHFGLHQGQIIELADMGILGYVILHSKTIVDALTAYQRYNVILCSVFHLEWEVEGDDVLIRYFLQHPGQISRHSVEEMASSLYHLINKLSNCRIPLHEIQFIHDAPADIEPYKAVFGKAPRFGEKDNVLRMSKDVLKYPILYSDARLLELFENMAQETRDELTQESLFSDRVVQWMKECVPSFFPTLQQTAEHFAISTRTLQNKLKAELTSYNELSVRVRKELAMSYLKKSDYTIGDIAYLLFFSEPSAFQSAFKKWTGVTPGQYRTQARNRIAPT
ncbi:AraC family transcriptional regulator [Paenibacillus sp. MZ04-78.2]|uniref:AraC family transcriptional regulator n=1 Tax=Paenibacillus sp. MZ04-78.2 TaxID=2962034 RepID=UPI0020B659E9|nr:AraC family transcriptional regulator [Paenibacillus sp. MZ04-78.2]MCP3775053.1 AraC family transcriptional regulator [Paenibacillus sp. MZ04-78.2]